MSSFLLELYSAHCLLKQRCFHSSWELASWRDGMDDSIINSNRMLPHIATSSVGNSKECCVCKTSPFPGTHCLIISKMQIRRGRPERSRHMRWCNVEYCVCKASPSPGTHCLIISRMQIRRGRPERSHHMWWCNVEYCVCKTSLVPRHSLPHHFQDANTKGNPWEISSHVVM